MSTLVPDYRREAVMAWLAHDHGGEYSALLWHLLTNASDAEFDEAWASFRALAVTAYGRPHQCEQCSCDYRFMRLEPTAECAVWECPECRVVAAAFGRDAWRTLGTTGFKTAYPAHGAERDIRYDAIREWIHDPVLTESQRVFILGLWFADAASFEAGWKQLDEAAREMFPPPGMCSNCQHQVLRLWRMRGGNTGALWRCEKCGTIDEVSDNWSKAEAMLRDVGATDEDIARVKNAAQIEGVAPLDAVAHVLEFNTKERARAALPPPNKCFKCGESDWEFESVSPNAKAAKWKCTYCGRIEMVSSVEPVDPKERAREAIPKGVQREVWRRDGGKCQRCGSQERLEFDHIIAVSRGGSNTARNIQLLCAICNGIKSDSEPGGF